MDDLRINERLVVPSSDLVVELSRSGGAGGQHVNKTESRVRLRFDLDGCSALWPGVKERIRKTYPSQITADGELLVVCSTHRSQHRNLEEARERLTEIIKQALHVQKKRKATKPTRASKERRLEGKRQRASVKKGRKKYRPGDSGS